MAPGKTTHYLNVEVTGSSAQFPISFPNGIASRHAKSDPKAYHLTKSHAIRIVSEPAAQTRQIRPHPRRIFGSVP